MAQASSSFPGDSPTISAVVMKTCVVSSEKVAPLTAYLSRILGVALWGIRWVPLWWERSSLCLSAVGGAVCQEEQAGAWKSTD